MNVSAAASASPDLLASTPSNAGVSSAATPDAGARTSKVAPPARSHGAARGREAGHHEFERALREEMDAAEGADAPNRAERHTVDADAAAAKCAARDDTAGDGDDAPPDGNGLPPWLPALPQPAPSQSASTLAGTTDGTVTAAATGAPDVAALPTTPPSDANVEPGPTPVTADATTAATAAPSAADAGSPDGEGAPLPPLPNGRALPAQARADGPESRAAAWRESARFAPAPEMPVESPTPAANDVAVEITQVVAPRTDAPMQRAMTVPVERRAPPTMSSAIPAPETAPVDVPVEPLMRRAVEALLAAQDSAAPAAVPTSPAGDGTVSAASLLAVASGASTAPTAPATSAAPLQIPVAVGAPDWDRQLAEKVQVLVDQGLTNAQLKLSPAHLGPLEIRISLQNDQASVWFGTHSHATREALEAAAPRLREALGAQGFANVGVSVDLQQQASRGQTPGQGSSRYEPEFSFAAGAAPSRVEPARAAPRGPARPRLDAFA